MKEFMKNKKTWIAVAIVIAVAWALWSGQPAPEIQ